MSSEPHDPSVREQRLNAIIAAYLQAVDAGQPSDRQTLLAEHADFAAELESFFRDQDEVRQLAEPMKPAGDAAVPEATVDLDNPTRPSVGTRVRYFGDYELIEEIARGGMGVVFKARQVSLNRVVALKMILAGQLASAAERQRFLNEAAAAANLDHPHIVPIYEVGDHEEQHYFSMKLINGVNLAQRLEHFSRNERDAVQLLLTVARAVHHAHERGVLHRDLKPANILIDVNDEPHITDFGLAKKIESDGEQTQTGAILGTPSYMPPEQAAGQKGAATTRADIYSLGAILYELLTGRPPFRGATVLETLKQVQSDELEPPSQLNPQLDRNLEAICLKCLARDPQERYTSAAALAEDLQSWLNGEPIQARPPSMAKLIWMWLRKNVRSAVWVLLIGALCGGASSLTLSILSSQALFTNMGETYAKFPSEPAPFLTGFQFPSLLIGPLLGVGLIAFVFMGPFILLLIQPKDRWADAVSGLATGIVAGLVGFAVGIGPVFVIALTIVPSITDFVLLGEATSLERFRDKEAPPRTHPTDDLVARYPDLADVEPSGRGSMLYPKIISDQVSGIFLGIWYGLAFALGVFSVVGVVQTMTAGYLRRRGMRLWRFFFYYILITLAVLGGCNTVVVLLSTRRRAWGNPVNLLLDLRNTLLPPGAPEPLGLIVLSLNIILMVAIGYLAIRFCRHVWRRWR